MTMPMRRVLVRHGQSEANVVQKELIADLDPEVIAEIYSRPDWMQRLSPLGVEQAKNAGDWIRREIGALASFDVIYASPFLRTFETACYAAGDEAVELTPEDRIIERDWGLYGKVSKTDQELFYPNTYQNKKIDPCTHAWIMVKVLWMYFCAGAIWPVRCIVNIQVVKC